MVNQLFLSLLRWHQTQNIERTENPKTQIACNKKIYRNYTTTRSLINVSKLEKKNNDVFPLRDTIYEKIQQVKDISTKIFNVKDEIDDWRNPFKDFFFKKTPQNY